MSCFCFFEKSRGKKDQNEKYRFIMRNPSRLARKIFGEEYRTFSDEIRKVTLYKQ